jgi:hypothetical protein
MASEWREWPVKIVKAEFNELVLFSNLDLLSEM